METLDSSPATAENESGVTGEVDSELGTTEGAESAPAAADTGKPERDKVQERIDKLTREKYEGLSRAERAEYRAQLLEQQLAEREAARAQTQTVAPSDEFPTLESVGWDEDKHRKAVDAYYDKKFEAKAENILSRAEQAKQREQLERDWERKQSDFIKSKPDYAEKVGSLPPSLMTDALAAEIKETGNPEIAYYLSEHLDKLAEIARLPPKAQARELGRIEARIEAAKASPPPVSKAPPPVGKIDGADSAAEKDPSQMSDAEYAKWRKRQIAQRR